MKKHSFFFIILFSLFSGLLLPSCNNVFNGGLDSPAVPSPAESKSYPEEKLVSLSGKFSCHGAVPVQRAGDIQRADSYVDSNSARSAAPYVEINATTKYFVTATGDGQTVEASVDSANRTFLIGLKKGIEWSIIAGIKQGDTILMQSEPYVKTFSDSDNSIDHIFEIKPSSSGIGSVKLEVYAGNKVKSVTVSCSDDTTILTTGTTLNFEDGKVILDLGHVPGGFYHITLKFTDEDGNSCYIEQAINVFENMETNYWLGASGLPLISDGVFTLSNSIASSAVRKIFYVGATGAKDSENNTASALDSNEGSSQRPLATLSKALEMVQHAYAGAADYTIYLYSNQSHASGSYEITSDAIGSLLIEGKMDSVATITGNSGASVFNVSSAKSVTFKNVKITGGNASQGGGIFVGSSADVRLGKGVEVSGNTASSTGNQLYVAGKLSLSSDNDMTLPSGECTGTTSGLDWAFEDGSHFASSKQALVTVKTAWAKGVETEYKILAVKGSDMPTLTTTNPPANHPDALGAFARTGYDLKGFYTGTDGSGTQYYNADGSSAVTSDLTSDTTLYAWWRAKGEVLATTSAGKTLSNGYYYIVSDDVTCNHPINSGITIDGTVSIYIEEGCTLAAEGSSGSDANGSLGAGGGKAGILLTSGNTLKLFGYGNLVANGGAGGKASAGLPNANDAWMQWVSTFKGNAKGGTGGAGGGGAGGGGAGIGTHGADGGNGGFGGAGRSEVDFNNHDSCIAASDVGSEGNGTAGASSSECGVIKKQSTITIETYGGAGGSYGAGGSVLTDTSSCGKGEATNYRVNDSGSGFSYDYSSGAGGAGGGGGAGTKGADIGTGGAGGGGGGGGAGGAINGNSSGNRKYIGGHGGGGGLPSGGTGQENIEQSRSTASGGSGGAAGTGGVDASVGTL